MSTETTLTMEEKRGSDFSGLYKFDRTEVLFSEVPFNMNLRNKDGQEVNVMVVASCPQLKHMTFIWSGGYKVFFVRM